MKKTNVSEKGLEDIFFGHLTENEGYQPGKSEDYDAERAVDWPKLYGFLKATQPLQIGELALHAEGGREKFVNRLNHEIASRGIIDVLRKGVRCYPVHLTLMYATPTDPEVELLSVIIDEFNTLWGGIRWTNADNALNWIKRTPETIAKDEKFSNAVRFAGEENARLECEAVMKRLVVESLKDSTEFYKQFKDNDAFRAWGMNRMFERAREIVAA